MYSSGDGMDRAVRGAYSRGSVASQWDSFRVGNAGWEPQGGSPSPQSLFLTRWKDSENSQKIGQRFSAELNFILREKNPEFFCFGLLNLSRRLTNSGQGEAALQIFGFLAEQSAFPALSSQARREAQALLGNGGLSHRAEFLIEHLFEQATSPSGLAAFGLAAVAGPWIRWRTLNALRRMPISPWWAYGSGARGIGAAASLGAEIPVFTLGRKAVDELMGRPVSWDGDSLLREMGSAAFLLGGIRLSALGNPAILPQARMVAGIFLAHRLTQELGLSPRQDAAGTGVEALATLLQFKVAQRLSQHLFGDSLSRFSWDLEQNLRARPPRLLSDLELAGSAGVLRVAGSAPPRALPKNIRIGGSEWALQMSPLKGEDGTERPIQSIEDLPEIRGALLPQWKDHLRSDTTLPRILAAYSDLLKKLNGTLKDERIPGAAPLFGREIAQSLLPNFPADRSIAGHPLPRLVAMSLAAHYQAIGDYLGQQIFEDLNAIFELLSGEQPNRYTSAEEIVLKGLELDPFNPWLIRLGQEISRNLGDIALQKEEYYEGLQKKMEVISQKWKDSPLARKFREDVVEKFREKPLEAGWGVISHLGKLFGLILNPLMFFTQNLPGLFHLIRYLNRWKKFGKDAAEFPGSLAATQYKTLFEINLYHGNYRNALAFADPKSKLPFVWELLERRALELRLGRKIELEPVPRLRPEAAPQTEALHDLEKSLGLSHVVSLEGIAGSAKTYLAVQLADKISRSRGIPVFWYTFKEGKKPDLERFTGHLAHFLELQQPQTGKNLLRQVQEHQDLRGKAEMLRVALARNAAYLFLDNFNVVAEEFEAGKFFRKFFEKEMGNSKIITVNQQSPDWFQKLGAQIFRRERMGYSEAFGILQRLGLQSRLSEDQMKEAYIATKGRPMALTLFGVLAKSAEPKTLATLLTDLEQKNNRASVLKHLFDRVYAELSHTQQRLLQYLALFRGPVTPGALAFFGPEGAAAGSYLLLALQELFLLEENQPGYFQVHEKFRGLAALHPGEVGELHRRAAEYHRSRAQEASDYLEAAYHYAKAGDPEQAVRMISRRTKLLLEKGYGERVGELFNLVESAGSLKSADLAAWYAEKAEWEQHQGNSKAAVDFLRRGLGIRRRMGDEAGAARIYGRLGQIFTAEGKQQRALNYYEAGLESFQKVEDWGGAAQIHAGIGRIYRDLGQLSRATLANLRALAMFKTTGNRDALAETYFQLGLIENEKGNWEQAQMFLNEALLLFRELGRTEAAQVEAILKYHP